MRYISTLDFGMIIQAVQENTELTQTTYDVELKI